MVATTHPLAAPAGLRMLLAGGTAGPGGTGGGGGRFALVHDGLLRGGRGGGVGAAGKGQAAHGCGQPTAYDTRASAGHDYCAAGKVLGRATIASMTTALLLIVSMTILPARMPE